MKSSGIEMRCVPGGIHVADVLGVDAFVLGDNDLAVLVRDVETGDLAAQPLGHELSIEPSAISCRLSKTKKCARICFGRQADGLQQDRDRHLAATVDPEVQDVLGSNSKSSQSRDRE